MPALVGQPPTDETAISSAGMRTFNLDLFLRLNDEYKEKPVIAAPRGQDRSSRLDGARRWAEKIDKRVGLRGKRVLEVGCGRGYLSEVLASEYDCTVVGVDVAPRPTWNEIHHDNLQLRHVDLSAGHDFDPRSFERIVSLVVWEHVKHPFTLLKTCKDLLADDGTFYLRANLHRGATASHRYREVFFPWPHLLFDDAIFCEFYEHHGLPPELPSWVNKLTYAQYLHYFDELDWSIEQKWLSQRPLDREFYERFEDVLSKYPEFDLTTEFFDVVLKKHLARTNDAPPTAPETASEIKTPSEAFMQAAARRLPVESSTEATLADDMLAVLDSPVYRTAKKVHEWWARATATLGRRPRKSDQP